MQKVIKAKQPQRVVSLLPSNTEIVCALGLQHLLVGRSHECDYPAGVQGLPICTKPRVQLEGSSKEIDDSVKKALLSAVSVYELTPQFKKLKPDLVVTQDQCEVCAVSLKDVEREVSCNLGNAVSIVSCKPNSLEDVYRDIRRVAQALDVVEQGNLLVKSMKKKIQAVAKKTSQLPRPKVACIEWIDPLMTAGNWIPTLVTLAGGDNVLSEPNKHSPWTKWADLLEADPDVIVIMPCGFDLQRTRQESQTLLKHPDWSKLTAVQKKRVYIVDGNQFFNRPGPRLVESTQILAEALHRGFLAWGHRIARAWEPL